jgi:protein PhnA
MNDEEEFEVRDSNGTLLADGDTVLTIKDIKVKGASQVLKRGTKIKNIKLSDKTEAITGVCTEMKGLSIRPDLVKKA